MSDWLQPGKQWFSRCIDSWDKFWFTPERPEALAMIRVLAGLMLCYTHLVWLWDYPSFLGDQSWVPNELSMKIHQGIRTWSYLWYVESFTFRILLHLAGLVVFLLLTIGCWSRSMAVLAWLITLSYCHRMSEVFFGLDQVNCMLAMYLMLGPCGAAYSVDAWRRSRAGGQKPAPQTSTMVAIRLIQLHMCIIYLFGGISKMRGQMWWDGSAVWYAVANSEYQSIDMTWMVHFPLLIAALTHVTVFWETFYCVLIWPRQTRPLFLALAVAVHGGIAMFLGMITFGLAMLIGNLAFISPERIARLTGWLGSHLRHTADKSTPPASRVAEPVGR